MNKVKLKMGGFDHVDIVKQINSKEIFCYVTNNVLESISHVVSNARLIDDEIVVDLKLLDTPMGRKIKEFNDDDLSLLSFCPFGYGTYDETGKVTNFKLEGIQVKFL